MPFLLVDYSSLHFGKKLPSKRSGKFIQIRTPDEEYLVMAPREMSTYHAQIAERFFAGKKLRGKMNEAGTHFTSLDGGWEIIGGGSWEIDEKAHTIRFLGASQAYGRFDRRGLGDKFRTAFPPEYTVSVE